MLKATDKHGSDGRRLVLGFDGGCFTCLNLAKRIDEQLGDKLEVQNLRDPQVEGWRKQALGEDAPWTPTLFEVRGERVRAWTGWRMGAVLARFLGLSGTWKVMRVFSEMNAPSRKVIEPTKASDRSRTVVGMSRGRFLKSLGGAAVAMSVLSGVGRLASAVEAQDFEPQSSTALKGAELERIARRVAGRKDVVKVMGEDWSRSVENGSRVISQCQNGDCVVVIGLGNGSCRVRRVNDKVTLEGNCVAARARKHRLSDGNSVLAVSYAMNQTERVAVLYQYERPIRQGKHKSQAMVYKLEDRKSTLKGFSANGRSAQLSSASTLTTSSTSCGSCESNDRQPLPVCVDHDWNCLAVECGQCVAGFGWKYYGLAGCVYVYCPWLLGAWGGGQCCDNFDTFCGGCA